MMKFVLVLLLSVSMVYAQEDDKPQAKSLAAGYAWVFGTAAAPLILPLLLLGRDTDSKSYGTLQDLSFIVIPVVWSFSPSMGRLYAGDTPKGWGGIGIRLGALAAAGAVALPCIFGGCNEALAIIPIAAAGVWISSAIYDSFWGTYLSVQKQNTTFSVSPYLSRFGSPGLMARIEF